jgi:hypothetical protein
VTGAQAQSRHNECTTPGAQDAKSDARFVPACDYQDRFTEPPHRATEAKQQGRGHGSPILVPGNVTDRPPPGHPRQRPPHPAPVAQWIEQAPSKRLAAGSSPAGGAHLCRSEPVLSPSQDHLRRAFSLPRRVFYPDFPPRFRLPVPYTSPRSGVMPRSVITCGRAMPGQSHSDGSSGGHGAGAKTAPALFPARV